MGCVSLAGLPWMASVGQETPILAETWSWGWRILRGPHTLRGEGKQEMGEGLWEGLNRRGPVSGMWSEYIKINKINTGKEGRQGIELTQQDIRSSSRAWKRNKHGTEGNGHLFLALGTFNYRFFVSFVTVNHSTHTVLSVHWKISPLFFLAKRFPTLFKS